MARVLVVEDDQTLGEACAPACRLGAVGLSFVGVPPGSIRLDAGLIAHVAGLLAGYIHRSG
jgi:hypothetical protein